LHLFCGGKFKEEHLGENSHTDSKPAKTLLLLPASNISVSTVKLAANERDQKMNPFRNCIPACVFVFYQAVLKQLTHCSPSPNSLYITVTDVICPVFFATVRVDSLIKSQAIRKRALALLRSANFNWHIFRRGRQKIGTNVH
jgi:hypothetical protein